MRLMFLGPPGSGKGTQAKILAEKLNLKHISTGDVLRDAVKNGTELGQKAKRYMDAGDLVPDSVILGMIKEILQNNTDGFIFDGFPRTAAQAEGLDKLMDDLGISLDAAINLDVNDKEVLKRLTGRFFCSKCGADFNINTRPPKAAGICDICRGALKQRDDDKTEVISNRLKVYREKTKPVEDYYRSHSLLKNVDGTKSFEQVTVSILNIVG